MRHPATSEIVEEYRTGVMTKSEMFSAFVDGVPRELLHEFLTYAKNLCEGLDQGDEPAFMMGDSTGPVDGSAPVGSDCDTPDLPWACCE